MFLLWWHGKRTRLNAKNPKGNLVPQYCPSRLHSISVLADKQLARQAEHPSDESDELVGETVNR